MLPELILGIFILAFTGVMYYEAANFEFNASITTIGPDYWPKIILAGMLILSVLLIIDIVRRKGRLVGKKDEEPKKYPYNFWIILGIILAYTFIIKIVGFIVSTFLFLISAMWILQIKKPHVLLTLTVSITIIMVVLFPKLMMVPLPRGTGVFRTFTLLFY
ncbi:MAG: tripartite tricarboxylate transporter TctB family protein [Desulfotomaculum sp.]|nr:tripartite tricarboxylate transporter TctB family protein [Desulfotomaculum sp.]